jgi:hypothetical protein
LLLYSSYLPLGVPNWTVIHINRTATSSLRRRAPWGSRRTPPPRATGIPSRTLLRPWLYDASAARGTHSPRWRGAPPRNYPQRRLSTRWTPSCCPRSHWIEDVRGADITGGRFCVLQVGVTFLMRAPLQLPPLARRRCCRRRLSMLLPRIDIAVGAGSGSGGASMAGSLRLYIQFY